MTKPEQRWNDTERNPSDKQFRRKEREFADFFENATISLHWVGPDGTILRANQAELDLLGYSHDEYVGHHIANFHADQDVIEDILQRLKAGEELHGYEARMRCKDGSVRHVLISSNVLWEDGKFIHTRCFTRDITECREAEAALRAREERFRAFVTASSDVVYSMSPDWTEMRHLEGRDFIADTNEPDRTWIDKYIHPDDQQRVMEVINEAIRTKSIFELEHRVLRVDGTLGWTFSRAIPIMEDDGEIIEWFGTASDVTRRKQAEEALRASKEKYRTLFESIDEGFCIIKMIFDESSEPVDYRFLEANPAFEKQSGLEQVVGKTMRQLIPEHEEYWFEVYGEVALTGEPIRFERYTEKLNRWLDLYAFRIGKPQSRKVAVIFTDITQRKKNLEEQKQLLREVEAEQEKLIDVFQQAPSVMAILQGPDHVHEQANELYKQLVGNRDLIGKSVRQAFPEFEGQGFFELLDRVYETGETYVGTDERVLLKSQTDGTIEEHYMNFVYQPIRDPDGSITGVFAREWILRSASMPKKNFRQ